MNVMLIVMADILVAVVAVMGVHEYFCMKRYDGFTVPFTKEMVEAGVIEPNNGKRILKEDRIGHYIGIMLSVLVWLMLSRFIAGISAVFVFVIAVSIQIILIKPNAEPIQISRNRYFTSHKKYMDALKYREYLDNADKNPPTISNQ